MKKTALMLLFALSGLLKAETINMKEAGASTDGKTLNTVLIAQSISRLSELGGGTLYFPAGRYLTGSIVLKSNITLNLDAGATLVFSDNFDDYLPFREMRHEGVMMKSFTPLIYAVDQENITIKGEGTLEGQGKKWWDEFYKCMLDAKKNGIHTINQYQTIFDQENDIQKIDDLTNDDWHGVLFGRFFRPPFIQPIRCKNVRIEGVTIQNSPFWTVNPEFCDNVKIQGITIHNPLSPNTDGINPESCTNVHISDCHISVGDDCITIKAGRDLQGRTLNAPCENITITNCTMLAGHGGVVIGSEMSGSVRNVTISNCVFDGTDRGIRIKSTRGRGGVVENIRVNNIVMRDIVYEAILLDLKYSKMPEEPLSDRTPIFRNIHISDMIGVNIKMPVYIRGLEESPITDISIKDLNIQAREKSFFQNCERIELKDVIVNGQPIQFELSK